MKKIMKTFALGLAAGAAISLGGLLFMICKNFSLPNLGGFVFSIGLTLVCTLKLNLFTGKVGYIANNKPRYLLDLLIMFIGNLCAAVIIGYLCRFIFKDSLTNVAEVVATNKISKEWWQLLSSGFFCGVFVYLAVDVFKIKKIPFVLRLIWLILCVAAFVNLGFDHCIANMFYLGFGGAYGNDFLKCVSALILVTITNAIGSIFVNSIKNVNR